jgi:hypothetical protein
MPQQPDWNQLWTILNTFTTLRVEREEKQWAAALPKCEFVVLANVKEGHTTVMPKGSKVFTKLLFVPWKTGDAKPAKATLFLHPDNLAKADAVKGGFTLQGNPELPIFDTLMPILENARRVVAEKQSTVQKLLGPL